MFMVIMTVKILQNKLFARHLVISYFVLVSYNTIGVGQIVQLYIIITNNQFTLKVIL